VICEQSATAVYDGSDLGYNVDAFVSRDTDLGALSPEIYSDNTHVCRRVRRTGARLRKRQSQNGSETVSLNRSLESRLVKEEQGEKDWGAGREAREAAGGKCSRKCRPLPETSNLSGYRGPSANHRPQRGARG
jgi:hypothetical protein